MNKVSFLKMFHFLKVSFLNFNTENFNTDLILWKRFVYLRITLRINFVGQGYLFSEYACEFITKFLTNVKRNIPLSLNRK